MTQLIGAVKGMKENIILYVQTNFLDVDKQKGFILAYEAFSQLVRKSQELYQVKQKRLCWHKL